MQTDLERHRGGKPILRKAGAGLVLVLAAVIVIKVAIGLIASVFWIVVAVAAVVGVIWALSEIRS
jgi:hypothetical protein